MASQSLSTLATSIASSNAHNVNSRTFSSLPLNSSKPDWLVNSLIGSQLSFRLKTSRPLTQKKHFSPFATISFSLPTAKPEKSSTEESPKWSARAIKSFAMGELEARKLKYPNTGTEALLMGILVEGTSLAAKFLRANGVTLFKVRDETVKLLGKSDMYFFSPEHPPLTEPAQRALDYAIDEKLKSAFKPPSYHDLRVNILKKKKKETEKWVEDFKVHWETYGVTIMTDWWTDGKGRTLINFLVNCPKGTIFLKSIDGSAHVHDATLIYNMLKDVIQEVGEKNVIQV